jgi:MOSC domain-containing protein YiiM
VRGVFAGPIRALRSPRIPGGASTAWRSAILKSRMDQSVPVERLGLVGDAQKEKKHHGGESKAVLVYSADHYAALWDGSLRPHAAENSAALRAMSNETDASEYGFGAFGENLTVEALDERVVFLGDLWRFGGCVLRITEPRGPCATLTRRWMRPALLKEVKLTAAAGWYNAVHTVGDVRAGDSVMLVERAQDEWSVARVFHLLESRVAPRAEVEALIEAPCAHEALRARLTKRLLTAGRTRD